MKREENKTQEKQIMQKKTITHHHQTNDQPVPKQWQPLSISTLQLLLLNMMLCGMGYLFGQLG